MPNVLVISIASGKDITGSETTANNAQIEGSGIARTKELELGSNKVVRRHIRAHHCKKCRGQSCLKSLLHTLEEEIRREMKRLGIKSFDRIEIIGHGNTDGIFSPIPGEDGSNQNIPEGQGLESFLKGLIGPKPISKGLPGVVIWACSLGATTSYKSEATHDIGNSIAEALGQFVCAFSEVVDFHESEDGEGASIPPTPKDNAQVVIYSPPVPGELLDELELAKEQKNKGEIETYQAKIKEFENGVTKGAKALEQHIGDGGLGAGLKNLKTTTTQPIK